MPKPFCRTKRLTDMPPSEEPLRWVWPVLSGAFSYPPDKITTTNVAYKLLNCRTARRDYLCA
jgi:hypothetical protein